MFFYYLSSIFFFFFSVILFLISLIFMKFNLMYFLDWNLLILNSVMINMFIFIDWMTLMFLFTVLLISSMIMLYCCDYMNHELNKIRFFFLVFFFILSMLLMILSPNMVSIILGWDGLGLVSYCLVIYYQSYFSYNSGMLTVLMNRVGDIMIMLSISVMFIYGSWNFINLDFYNLVLFIMVLVASFTKSAQIPFSSWLPAAMAAPTPVSSLVHSSTLVTAGVYLLVRFNNLIYKNEMILNFIMISGMLTMMMSGFSANYEFDLKKIIAYSTLSQLGLMMLIFGMKFYLLSFFHLIIHAMFKSMMFMCSGVIIHSMNNFQDIRFMGNLKEFMPLTLMLMMVSNFSLCGMPFFSGFYSKDLILEKIFMSYFFFFLMIFLLISTMLTVLYSLRLLKFLMMKNFNFFSFSKIYDSLIMNISMLILMINSLMFGYFLNWLMFLNIEEIYLMKLEKMMILILCFLSVFLINKLLLNKKINYFSYFFGMMWMMYYLNKFLSLIFLLKMNKYYYLLDKGVYKFIFEDLLKYLLKYFNLMKFNNSYLIYLILMLSYLILLIMFF